MTAGEDVFRMIVSEVRADHRYANGSVMTVTVELQDEHRGASMSYGCALDDAPQVGDRAYMVRRPEP